MSHRPSALLTIPVLSLVFVAASALVACGGGIESSSRSDGSDGTSSGSSGGSNGGGGSCFAAATCDGSDQPLSSESACPQDDAYCYSRSVCGATIWCARHTVQCAAIPSCKPGYSEVSSCPTDANCIPETLCGSTIYCLAQCAGYPVCNNGDTQVASSSQCLQDDATCYPRTGCGATIWCTGQLAVDAGTPPPQP